jgi:hypothetical protein
VGKNTEKTENFPEVSLCSDPKIRRKEFFKNDLGLLHVPESKSFQDMKSVNGREWN